MDFFSCSHPEPGHFMRTYSLLPTPYIHMQYAMGESHTAKAEVAPAFAITGSLEQGQDDR